MKTVDCESCWLSVDLFPCYLVSEDSRHPKNVLVCSACGDLNEVAERSNPGSCHSCKAELRIEGPARRGRCTCPHCGHENRYPRSKEGPLRHGLFAIEYYNPYRKAGHKGRFFKKPDAKDLARVATAQERWGQMSSRFVPDEEILPDDETDRLHRWGYSHYRQMFKSLEQMIFLRTGI